MSSILDEFTLKCLKTDSNEEVINDWEKSLLSIGYDRGELSSPERWDIEFAAAAKQEILNRLKQTGGGDE